MARPSRWDEGFNEGALSALAIMYGNTGMVDSTYRDVVDGCGGEKLLKHAEATDDSQIPFIREALGLPSRDDPRDDTKG